VNYCTCPDFAVNTLGTCKHIEYTLRRLSRRPAGRQALAQTFVPEHSEVRLRYGAQRDVVFRPGTACPRRLLELATHHFGPDGVLHAENYARFHQILERATAAGGKHEIRCYDDALAFVSERRDRADVVGRIDAAFPRGADDPAFDSLVHGKLYPYQRQGAWFAARAGRCLIADDMGLGKTVQAIAAAEVLARHADVQRVLVICPTSLKHQWRQEIERFTDRSAVVVEGLIAARAAAYRSSAFYHIVNYDVIHRDRDRLRELHPDLIILDEAQRIKNWQTRAARSVKSLESDHAFVLTGTPLENRLEELHSIVEFVDRHRLGPTFKFLARHQHVDEHGRVIGYQRLDEIADTLAPILVRRTKAAVLEQLPARLEKRYFVDLTAPQRAHHEENREIVARIVAKWRRYSYLSELDQRRLMIALQNMRMACDSTFLLDAQTDHGTKADEVSTLLEEVLEDPAAKVVVFSQWLRMHELIVRRIQRRKWDHVLFHGGVPGPRRKGLIARFRDDPACRLFLSTDAGGVGLNLQHANVVINMDLPWNPAVLEQRVGRVHRLGQHRPVRVVHFIAKDTIEESMLGLLAFKSSLFAGVLDGGAKEVFLGGSRLKQFMESVERVAFGIATAAANGAPAAEAAPAAPAAAAALAVEALAPAAPVAAVAVPAAPTPVPSMARAAGVDRAALGDLLTAGASFLNQLGQALKLPDGAALPDFVHRDESTGQAYIRLPLPQGDALQVLAGLLRAFAAEGAAPPPDTTRAT
jgi:superfamily II DNA or RNA helicase